MFVVGLFAGWLGWFSVGQLAGWLAGWLVHLCGLLVCD